MENPFEIIIEKLNNIEMLLKQFKSINEFNGNLLPNADEIMNLEQLSTYINQSKSTVYKYTANRMIPYYKSSKRLYFKKAEINTWLTKNRIKTTDEIELEAINYIIRKGKV